MTITETMTAVIPAAEHGVGFVAVAIGFPTRPDAHRIERIYHRPGGAAMGVPTKFDGSTPFVGEIRPACRPDSDPGERFYELSVPYALDRGAVPCERAECFGGEPGC